MSDEFNEWAVLELMGHRRLAGYVSETTLAGGSFLRIDVPTESGATTQFYSPSSVYCLTPTTEENARKLAANLQPRPIHRFEFEAGPRDDDMEQVW